MRNAMAIFLMLYTSPAFSQVTLKDMIGDDRYWPQACDDRVCVLTGLGGIVSVWEKHIRDNSGKKFIVSGVCASACEIAYRLALTLGETIYLMDGAELIAHEKVPTVFD